ncbi:MAG: TIGR02266 family protein [Myxococcales bacterium]|nr:TIGR02266 family protein [Myxococcales bacterium]
MADPNTRQGKRTPVTLKIKFKSETLEQFIERYAVDVSQGGIFIRTKEPLAVGTQMRFEFQLRDASPLIAGEGTVVWTRENDPSRPAIAPGMGVRFDRLAEGSQTILERILTEKAKQAPQRPANESSKPPMFTDTPTRVAPAPVQEALLGKSEDTSTTEKGPLGAPRRKRPDSFGDQGTPLPTPMPFHSDADEFPEEAFEEATKVRALDELIAQTADQTKTAVTTPATPAAPDELAARRGVRADSTIADPPSPAEKAEAKAAEKAEAKPAPVADRDSAPGLPSPPETDAKPAEREPKAAKTQLGLEPAKAMRPGTPSTPPATSPAPARPVAKDAPTKPTGMRAVASEAKVPDAPRKSGAPIVLLLLLLLAAGGAAVWFFVLRPKGDDADVATNKPGPGSGTQPGSGSANVAVSPGSGATGSATPETGSGSATAMTGSNTGTSPGSGSATPESGSGSAVAMTGSNAGAGPGSATPPPAAVIVETAISAAGAEKVMIEVLGTDQTGPSPLKAKLEKGKAYRARVQAPGFMLVEIDVKGGEKASAKLVAKPRVIDVTSDPPGAQIVIDSAATGKTTPAQVELSKTQAGKKSVRVAIKKAGMKTIERVIDAGKYTEDADKMIAKLDEKLEKAPVVVQQPRDPGTGGTTTTNQNKGSGAGSATPASGGSGTEPSGTGSAGTGGGGTGSATTGTGTTGTGTTGTGTTGTGTTGTGTTGTGSGSAKPPAGTGSGSAKPPAGTGTTGTGTGSATKPPAGTGSGSATKPPANTGSGSSEPEPDFLK